MTLKKALKRSISLPERPQLKHMTLYELGKKAFDWDIDKKTNVSQADEDRGNASNDNNEQER